MKMNFKLIKLSLPVFYLSLLTICSSLKQVSIFSQMDFDSAGNNNNNPVNFIIMYYFTYIFSSHLHLLQK